MRYLLGLDIGTSGTKTVLFDEQGNAIAESSAAYPLSQPKNGWAEQNPTDWWDAVKETVTAVVRSSGVNKQDIVSIGLSGQMHGLVMLDAAGTVLRPAILWCDGRTASQCREMEQILGKARLIELTGNPAMEGFTASKILWVRQNEPDVYEKCKHILLPKDYIRYRLCGELAIDMADASGTQLLDVNKREWSAAVCSAFGVDMAWLPTAMESPELSGRLSPAIADELGLPAGLPIAAGGGDNACAALGTGVCREGKAFTTVGTSGVIVAHTDRVRVDLRGNYHAFCAAVPGAWHMLATTQAAGGSLNWFRNQLAAELSYKELDTLCEKLPIGAENLLFLPFLMGERQPALGIKARGVFFGLSAIHQKPHMARAVMEGVGFSLYDLLCKLQADGADCHDMMLCGGGAKSRFWAKMFADIYGIDIKTGASGEGACLGAAILGGCAAGVYTSVAEGCDVTVRTGKTYTFDANNHQEYMRFYDIYRDLYPKLKNSFAALNA
ncbi:MAG: xylulokinase [Ruminococcaceae bacterium]|nr:xylulokinase [Oscillospiraceae bacterium]